MKSTKTKKQIEQPKSELCLNFTSNALQTYLIEIFKSMEVVFENFQAAYMLNDGKEIDLQNVLKFYIRNDYHFLLFIDESFLKNNFENNKIFVMYEHLLKETKDSKNITSVILNSKEINGFDLDLFTFFVQTHLKIKTIKLSNSELPNYLANYYSSLLNKDTKSQITFYDSKPQKHTNLSNLAGITDQKTLTFIDHLICIPGISEKKAIAVATIYPDLASLMIKYKSKDINLEEKQIFLKDIEVAGSNPNVKKKLGAILSEKIYNVFMNKDPNFTIS